uniref:Uncharacterized protein n=1 Tax=Timspurckia oligopyrenoides TaxID=708627 RepID=A0A7S0ZEJ2_9RHOD
MLEKRLDALNLAVNCIRLCGDRVVFCGDVSLLNSNPKIETDLKGTHALIQPNESEETSMMTEEGKEEEEEEEEEEEGEEESLKTLVQNAVGNVGKSAIKSGVFVVTLDDVQKMRVLVKSQLLLSRRVLYSSVKGREVWSVFQLELFQDSAQSVDSVVHALSQAVVWTRTKQCFGVTVV